MKKPFFLMITTLLLITISCQKTQATSKPAYSKKYLLGKFSPAEQSNFSLISSVYTTKSKIYMRTEAYNEFIKMYEAAKKVGINLYIVSATRNFYSQKWIWEAKWTGIRKVNGKNLSVSVPNANKRAKTILLYSSMPGTSRHHWGTDIDINSLVNSYFTQGKGKAVYQWMLQNASNYGFYLVYTAKPETRATGYEEEKWHWTYLPLSKEMLIQYKQKIKTEDIKGFRGDSVVKDLNIINDYVLGINPVLNP